MTEHPLVQRLREYNESRYDSGRGLLELIDRAADEIDRLTREINDRRYLTSGLIDQKDAEIDRLTSEIDASHKNELDAQYSYMQERALTGRLRAALEQVETVMMLVEPRSHKAEYLAALKAVREALRGERGEKLLQEGLLGEK